MIQRLISDKRPEQLKLDFTLWTRAAVMLLIERECGYGAGAIIKLKHSR